jgi:uncharacterized protein (DUF1015 family)
MMRTTARSIKTSPLIQPFTAIRPTPERAPEIVARPYDVLSFAEAKAAAMSRPFSFLHVSRAEIDLPVGTDPYDPEVYAQAASAFRRMMDDGALIREAQPSYYVYRMSSGAHVQTGIAAAGSVSAYRANRIRRHEHTRPDKEMDRTRQIEAVGAHTGPVLTVHAPDPEIDLLLEQAAEGEPVADAVTDEGTRHQIWPIIATAVIEEITQRFEAMTAIWIADGHHRSAAAARVAEAHAAVGANSADRFLLVSFPADQVRILDYNRVVRDLHERSERDFFEAVAEVFTVAPAGEPVRPEGPGIFGMLLGGHWYRLQVRQAPLATASAVDRLDVSLLNDRLLAPILGIGDPRTDKRIDFVGGGRGLEALDHCVRSGDWTVAFSLHPTRLADLIAVADAGQVMPPKSTWFEPKLADGLLSLPLTELDAATIRS